MINHAFDPGFSSADFKRFFVAKPRTHKHFLNSNLLSNGMNDFDIKENAFFICHFINLVKMLLLELLCEVIWNLVDETAITRPPDDIPPFTGITEVIANLVAAMADIPESGRFVEFTVG